MLATLAKHHWIGVALPGAVAAGLLMVKINVGIFAILALALAVLSLARSSLFVNLTKILAMLAALALPIALMLNHIDDASARLYCYVVTVSIAALLFVMFLPNRPRQFSDRDCWLALSAFVATLAIIWLGLVAQGVSSDGVLAAILLTNLKVNIPSHAWYRPLPLPGIAIVWCAGGIATAIAVARGAGLANAPSHQAFALLKVLFGGGALAVAMAAPDALPWLVPPFCWLLLFPPSEGEVSARQGFPRSLLAATAVMQTLYAYPIAGSQAIFIRTILIMVPAVILMEGLSIRSQNPERTIPAALRGIVTTIVLSCVALTYVVVDVRESRWPTRKANPWVSRAPK
jgi:hypothetical protein